MELGELWYSDGEAPLAGRPSMVGLRRQVSSAGALGAELNWSSGFTPSHIASNRETELWKLQFSLENRHHRTSWDYCEN